MSKILSLIGFAVLLVWSWSSVQSASRSTHLSTHTQIQNKLGEIIKATLAAKKPQAQNIQILKIWSEFESQHKIKAYFTYKYTETAENAEASEQIVNGQASLYQEPTEDKSTEKWVLQSVSTLNESITFTEGLVISPDMAIPDATNPDVNIQDQTNPSSSPAPTQPAPAPENKQSH